MTTRCSARRSKLRLFTVRRSELRSREGSRHGRTLHRTRAATRMRNGPARLALLIEGAARIRARVQELSIPPIRRERQPSPQGAAVDSSSRLAGNHDSAEHAPPLRVVRTRARRRPRRILLTACPDHRAAGVCAGVPRWPLLAACPSTSCVDALRHPRSHHARAVRGGARACGGIWRRRGAVFVLRG